MQTDLKKLIQTIKTGSPLEVKLAQKQVGDCWHNYFIPHREEGKLAFRVFLEELKTFDQIKDVDHQAYFINTLKWPLWVIGEDYFEDWADFFLINIQHPAGKIRQAVISATDYLILDISHNLRYDNEKENGDLVAKNKIRFGYFVMTVEGLVDQYYERKFNKYKYISSLPVGIYKSLNKLLLEILLKSEYFEKMYQDFLNELRAKRKSLPPQTQEPQIYKLNIDVLELRNRQKKYN